MDNTTKPLDSLPVIIKPQLIDEALLHLQDQLERSSLNYIVLGDVAKQLKEQNDALIMTDKVEVAILRRHYTVSGSKMFNQLIMNNDYIDKVEYIDINGKPRRITYMYKGEAPIVIRIIDTNWQFLQNPDKVFYRISEFPIPNPFKKYWEVKALVK